jgi:hypothetical protein
MKSTYQFLLFSTLLSLAVMGCKKQLETSPNSNVLVPNTPTQLQGLLDNPDVFGYGHTLGLLSADEFYFIAAYYSTLPKTMKNVYTWQKYPFDSAETHYDYKRIYKQVLYANVVLQAVNQHIAAGGGDRDLNRIKGDALFKRALAFNMAIELFAPAYDLRTASTDMGILLILKSEDENPTIRPSVQACYDQVLSDLNEAGDLLQTRPDPLNRNRASRMAALALSARIHLCMGKWQEAALEAGTVMQGYDSLIDYNMVNSTLQIPFPGDNREVIYPLKAPDNNDENALIAVLPGGAANVDSNFIRSYDPDDLRLHLYFRQHGRTWGIRTSYTGTFIPFEGIGISEVCLILAEANARLNKTDSALFYLKKLLSNRYTTGTNLNLPAANQPDSILDRILSERKKELAFRGQRWPDIKRLNKQNCNIIQQRIVDGNTITIDANDLRYALPLPEPTIRKYGLLQNPR